MEDPIKMRYCIRVPFPDFDLWCFVLDKDDKVYYTNKEDARIRASEFEGSMLISEPITQELKLFGCWNAC